MCTGFDYGVYEQFWCFRRCRVPGVQGQWGGWARYRQLMCTGFEALDKVFHILHFHSIEHNSTVLIPVHFSVFFSYSFWLFFGQPLFHSCCQVSASVFLYTFPDLVALILLLLVVFVKYFLFTWSHVLDSGFASVHCCWVLTDCIVFFSGDWVSCFHVLFVFVHSSCVLELVCNPRCIRGRRWWKRLCWVLLAFQVRGWVGEFVYSNMEVCAMGVLHLLLLGTGFGWGRIKGILVRTSQLQKLLPFTLDM